MSYIKKPVVQHPGSKINSLGLSVRDYEGSMSTLCAGCGHDSVTAALIQALFELEVTPHRVAKLSGIGCSSKTTAYFLNAAHGLNSVHGRMPSIASGANAACQDLLYIGISGDGDSLSIGLGQFVHAMRRNLNMLYIIENNGVYGLTKGQFSASADVGSKSKYGKRNEFEPIDPVLIALTLGGSFVARSFAGDKQQLVPLIKAGLMHKGFALVDVISPCVTFNDHDGSTKSYHHTRSHYNAVTASDYIAPRAEITADYAAGEALQVTLHDGSSIKLRKIAADYEIGSRSKAAAYIQHHQHQGEVVTGLLYVDTGKPDMHAINHTVSEPLRDLQYAQLCPGADNLIKLQEEYR